MKKTKSLSVTRDQMADLLGIEAPSVTRLVSLGMPVLTVGGGRGNKTTFDAVAALQWMRERQEASAPGNGSIRDQYLSALRDRVNQDIETRSGKLVSRDQVILAGQMQVKAWSGWLRGLPRRLVVSGALPREKEVAVKDIIHQLLTEIVAWRPVKEGARGKART